MVLQLQEFGTGVAYFKGGLYGDAGTGKTYTATQLAIFIKQYFKLEGDIFFFDTETGAEYVNRAVKEATGKNIIGVKSRTLGDAIEFIAESEKRKAAVTIFDSATHIDEEIDRSYLAQLNERLAKQNKQLRTKIEWQDRGPLNAIKARFTDSYLNSRQHIIICGRAKNMWEMELNDETGKKELNKVGTAMKTNANLAYEPSFLAEMAREQLYENGVQRIVRTMTVLKDRFKLMDGKQFKNPTGKDFLPHLELLTPGAINEVDVTKQTPMTLNDDGDTSWAQERMQRQIYTEEITALFTKAIPGKTALEQKAKVIALEQTFGTGSWTAIEKMPSVKLKNGINILRDIAIPSALDQIKAEEKENQKPAKAEKASAK